MVFYVTKDDEMIDEICAKHYGTDNLSASIDLVFSANYGLVNQPIKLSAGQILNLPVLPSDAKLIKSQVRLWD